MRYIDICTADAYVVRMKELAGSKVAKIPILYVNCGTEYWISENGDKAFVVREICGRMFIDNIKIFTKKRSVNSETYIRYRTNRNTQITVTVSRAVYGAFILKDTLPKHLPYHKDGNPFNCALVNLESTEVDGRLKTNLDKFAEDYNRNFARLVVYCQAEFTKERQDAEDVVADSFITACERRTAIRNFLAVWVLSIQKRFKFRQYAHSYQPIENSQEFI